MRQTEHTKPLRCVSGLYSLPVLSTALHYRNTNSVKQSVVSTVIRSLPLLQSLKKFLNSIQDALCFLVSHKLCKLSRSFQSLDQLSKVLLSLLLFPSYLQFQIHISQVVINSLMPQVYFIYLLIPRRRYEAKWYYKQTFIKQMIRHICLGIKLIKKF